MLTLVPLAAVHQLNLEQMLRLVDTHTAPAEGYEYEHGWLAAPPGINTPDFVERAYSARGPGPRAPVPRRGRRHVERVPNGPSPLAMGCFLRAPGHFFLP